MMNEVKFKYTESDFTKPADTIYLERLSNSKLFIDLMVFSFSVYFIFMGALSTIDLDLYNTYYNIFCIFVFSFSVLCTLLRVILLFTRARKRFVDRSASRMLRDANAGGEEQICSWDDRGIRFASACAHIDLAWNRYHRWFDDERTISLFRSEVIFYVLPKRALTPEQISEVLGHLRDAGVPEHRKSRMSSARG